MEPISFHRHPETYRHWKLSVDGAVARLTLDVKEPEGWRPGYPLKLNSYDLGVDLELADAVQRLRFEHPGVRAVVLSSALDKVFCSGANIYMLQSSSHAFKVNFCKFTNETRLYLEEYAREAGVRTIAALNGTASGGGYELALACDETHLIDDGNSAVSFPETPLLGVLPGTGGLTRLVDKRRVRRDLADVFSTLAEGCRGQKALKWKLVDAVHPRSKFAERIEARVEEVLAQPPGQEREGPGLALEPVRFEAEGNVLRYRFVTLDVNPEERVATLTVRGPEDAPPSSVEELRRAGGGTWVLQCARELDDAVLQLRFACEQVGLVLLKTQGDPAAVLAHGRFLEQHQGHWLVHEIVLQWGRVLRRIDLTGRSFFALLEPGSCFAGILLELALCADRSYMLDDPDEPVTVELDSFQRGTLPMSNGLARLETRFLGDPEAHEKVLARAGAIDARAAEELGLVTFAPDSIDWEDEVRVAVEERASFSPDALTGMEASLRFAGPETLETKIFGRLSAWQNWIFTRPNATGKTGALTLYGHPSRPSFDWKRT